MIEITFHGRGGQGAVTAASLLAEAAFREGKYVQKIPIYGTERRGAPVMAFVRINSKPIRVAYRICEPDCIVVLDPKLYKIINVTKGLKEGGIVVLNEKLPPEMVNLRVKLSKIATVDATGIAIDVFGPTSIPITNTAMLGALSAVTELVKLDSLIVSIKDMFSGEMAEKNVKATTMGYEKVKKRGMG